MPLIYTTLSERLSAVRNIFGNTTPTLYGLYDVRYLYRTDSDKGENELIKCVRPRRGRALGEDSALLSCAEGDVRP